ncbi:PstS family phosphate ABC transporter substrate-binding protein [Halobium salinum]|uniref:PstS family phosphate ABC transporter substrate-binding protein n=1 Tax=Halobium salinum TaxID=1364940 RepID=A0ABD5PBR2_9EURY|nr:substrate-binding domain-containing protein [Halobium salinum]
MSDRDEGDSSIESRRKFLAGVGAAGVAAVAGCSGESGGGSGDSTTESSGGSESTTTGSSDQTTEAASGETETAESEESQPSRVSAEGSSTVYPISNTASSYWNSNPPADDEEYWGPGQYDIDTDKRLADYFAGLYGFEATGETANPPFPVQVGLSHSGTGVKAVMEEQVDIGNSSAPVEAELDNPSEETLNKFKDHVVGRDGQPIVVSKQIYDAGVTKLTAQQVTQIYQGEITNWSEIDSYEGEDKEIYAVGRAEGSGTDTAFRSNLLGDANASMSGVDTRKGQNQQVQTLVQQSDNAIAYMALAFVSDQVPAVAFESEDGTVYELGEDPGLGASDYPLNRDLHMYTWEETDKRESAFINMMLSPMGQELFVQGNNYFPLPQSEIENQRSKLASQSN